jgi:Ca2+-binding RTX toxin-like protein
VATADGTTQVLSVTMHGTNDAATNLTMVVTAAADPNNLPSGPFAQFTPTDPDGGGATTYSMTLAEFDASTLSSIVDGTPDLTLSSTGTLSATSGGSGIENSRVYEMQVTATQGAASYTEAFTIFTGTSGGETINNAFNAGDDAYYALNGADMVFAGSGDDTVFGQNGVDQIHGGDGNDTLTGGGGNDTFFFDTSLNAATNVDTIKDFSSGNDHISLLKTGLFSSLTGSAGNTTLGTDFSANQTTAGTGSEHVFYDPATGNLYYDANAGAHADAVLFANLTNTDATHPTIATTDFVIG